MESLESRDGEGMIGTWEEERRASTLGADRQNSSHPAKTASITGSSESSLDAAMGKRYREHGGMALPRALELG
jgi:hypothetical protein